MIPDILFFEENRVWRTYFGGKILNMIEGARLMRYLREHHHEKWKELTYVPGFGSGGFGNRANFFSHMRILFEGGAKGVFCFTLNDLARPGEGTWRQFTLMDRPENLGWLQELRQHLADAPPPAACPLAPTPDACETANAVGGDEARTTPWPPRI